MISQSYVANLVLQWKLGSYDLSKVEKTNHLGTRGATNKMTKRHSAKILSTAVSIYHLLDNTVSSKAFL